MDLNQPPKNKPNKSTSVAPSPFNGLKLDALLWFCGGIILLLLLENLNINNLLELGILFVFGLCAVFSIIVRARRIVAAHSQQNPD